MATAPSDSVSTSVSDTTNAQQSQLQDTRTSIPDTDQNKPQKGWHTVREAVTNSREYFKGKPDHVVKYGHWAFDFTKPSSAYSTGEDGDYLAEEMDSEREPAVSAKELISIYLAEV